MSLICADQHFDVIVAGAGPVGLCLAIDLGRRGVRCLLLERNPRPADWPKMDRTNARSMELFRRVGLADQIRELGFPADIPMDVFLMRRMSEPPVAVIPFPSVQEWRERIAACHDGSLPLEPYQLVAQNKLEPFLKRVAENTPNVTVRYGLRLDSLQQRPDGVTAQSLNTDGEVETFTAQYLVGTDGGSSTVRRAVGITLEGTGNIRELRQVVFYSPDLFDKLQHGKGRHYSFLDEHGALIVVQGDRKEFTLHTDLPEDTDFKPVIERLLGFECDLEIRKVASWRHHLLLADRYRADRVFLAGDSAHLVIPTGGLGMNTGVGDAFNLSWKLAAAIHGWGGETLLDSYETERRPVGAFNVESAGWAADAVPQWRKFYKAEMLENTPESATMRREIGEAFVKFHGRMHSMRGAEFGYCYPTSPVVSAKPDNEPIWDRQKYEPHTRPGARAPHMWLNDGTPLQDNAGNEFTLLDFAGLDKPDDAEVAAIVDEFLDRGVDLKHLPLREPQMRSLYDKRFYLLRPDLHIAWRGDELPKDCLPLVDLVTGNIAP